MSKNNLHIDESTHQREPNPVERLKHAFLALLLGFLLINIIGFWMFPGPGIFGLYMVSSAHRSVAFLGGITNIVAVSIPIICGIIGWFNGKYFTDRLEGYIHWWKFW